MQEPYSPPSEAVSTAGLHSVLAAYRSRRADYYDSEPRRVIAVQLREHFRQSEFRTDEQIARFLGMEDRREWERIKNLRRLSQLPPLQRMIELRDAAGLLPMPLPTKRRYVFAEILRLLQRSRQGLGEPFWTDADLGEGLLDRVETLIDALRTPEPEVLRQRRYFNEWLSEVQRLHNLEYVDAAVPVGDYFYSRELFCGFPQKLRSSALAMQQSADNAAVQARARKLICWIETLSILHRHFRDAHDDLMAADGLFEQSEEERTERLLRLVEQLSRRDRRIGRLLLPGILAELNLDPQDFLESDATVGSLLMRSAATRPMALEVIHSPYWRERTGPCDAT